MEECKEVKKEDVETVEKEREGEECVWVTATFVSLFRLFIFLPLPAFSKCWVGQ